MPKEKPRAVKTVARALNEVGGALQARVPRPPAPGVSVPPIADRNNLGSKLKRLRSERDLTLEELGQRASVSRSALSKIENGQVSPTYDILQKISRGLNIDLVELFDARKQTAPAGRRSVTRAGGGLSHLTATYAFELLATELARKKILPFKSKILARSLDEFGGWVRHEGEEFLFVLSGQVQVFTEHYSPAVLDVGDSIYFDSEMGHACVSLSEEPAEVIWVCTGVMPPEAT